MNDYKNKSNLSNIELYDLEAESALLGALFLNNEEINRVLAELSNNIKIFKKRENQIIFYAIKKLINNQSDGIDAIVVKDFLKGLKETPEGYTLKDKDLLEVAGGMEYIQEIQENATTFINYDEYIKIIRNKFLLRRLLKTLNEVYDKTVSNPNDIDFVLENAERKIFEIAQEKKVKKSFAQINELIKDQVKYIQLIKEKGGDLDTYVKTDYDLLDTQTGGFKPGQLIILAARPAMGKTAFAINIAKNVALNHNKGVVFFSLEMADEEIAQRLLFMHSSIRGHDALQGFLAASEFDKLYETEKQFDKLPIFVDDTAGLTPIQMTAKLRRLISKKSVDLVIVDYLQLMNTSENYNTMNAKITVISRYLKEIAKEFKVPVIALSQLSRKTEQRDKKIPRLSDLRESGAIEQDADIVLFLYRKGYYDEDEDGNETDIIIAKNRNGPTGKVKLHFHKEYGRFDKLSFRDD